MMCICVAELVTGESCAGDFWETAQHNDIKYMFAVLFEVHDSQ